MCVQVRYSTRVTRPWDPETATITIPSGLSRDRQVRAIRAVLIELDVAQPGDAAFCWCGATITTPAPRVPVQRTEVMSRGA